MLNDLFVGLTELDQTGRVSPGAAYEWSISDDGLTYVFHLRPEGRWRDGTPVTARNFVLAFARLFTFGYEVRQSNLYADIHSSRTFAGNSPPITKEGLSIIEFGVKALDVLTLEVKLDRPVPCLLFVLSKPRAIPVPSHLHFAIGEACVAPENVVGNGLYRLFEAHASTVIKLQ